MIDRAIVVGLAAAAVLGFSAQNREPGPTFEVATVKLNKSGEARPRHTVVPQSGQVTATAVGQRPGGTVPLGGTRTARHWPRRCWSNLD